MQNNNPLTEGILGIIAVLFVVGGVFLLYVGKIDFAGAALMFGFPAALLGINQALKAPSPSQQETLNKQQDNLQSLVSLFATHTHPVPTPPATPTQPVQPVAAPVVAPPTPQFVPDPGVSMAAYQTGMMPAVTPPVQP